MTKHDEIALVHAWVVWRASRVVEDDVYVEFYDKVVRDNPQFRGINVFEALDVLVNSVDPDRRESA